MKGMQTEAKPIVIHICKTEENPQKVTCLKKQESEGEEVFKSGYFYHFDFWKVRTMPREESTKRSMMTD